MKKTIVIVLFLVIAATAFAQSERTTDFGGILTAEVSTDLPQNFGLSVEEELRFDHNGTELNRWLNSVGVDYTFWHNRMKFGLTGDYIRRGVNMDYYENRYRLGAQLTYSETYRRFKFSLRTKMLSTFFDERTGEHRVNPKLYWRNRLQATYQQPNSRFKYALSAELFWLTNDPRVSFVDNLRTVASVEYRLSRRCYLAAFARMDNDLQVKEPVDRFYLGLNFQMKY